MSSFASKDVSHISKFDGTNFPFWKFQICLMLEQHELIDIVFGKEISLNLQLFKMLMVTRPFRMLLQSRIGRWRTTQPNATSWQQLKNKRKEHSSTAKHLKKCGLASQHNMSNLHQKTSISSNNGSSNILTNKDTMFYPTAPQLKLWPINSMILVHQ